MVPHTCRDFGARVEALKILQELLACMGKAAAAQLPSIMSSVWRLFEAAPPAFEALVIPNPSDDGGGGGHDTTAGSGDGGGGHDTTAGSGAGGGGAGGGGSGGGAEGDVTFETVVEQLYEFLLTVQGSTALQPQLKGALRQVAHNTICFMQVRRMHELHALSTCMGRVLRTSASHV